MRNKNVLNVTPFLPRKMEKMRTENKDLSVMYVIIDFALRRVTVGKS